MSWLPHPLKTTSANDRMDLSFSDYLKFRKELVDAALNEALPGETNYPPVVFQAVRYSLFAGGKRLRPILCLAAAEAVGSDGHAVLPVACALEMIHTYSLIHDDLPAMDDDDIRRGRPTTHKQFGEAMAILAGDAMVVLAFELLARHVRDRRLAGEMVLELAQRTGWAGMIGGQAADIAGQSQDPSLDRTRYIHDQKTAALFEGACRLGAMVGRGDADGVAALGRFGRCLGRAFQIADDLLDVTSTAEKLGKKAGKDVTAGKQTYPGCVGVEQSRRAAGKACDDAIAELHRFGTNVDDLRELARYVVSRSF